MIYSLKYLDTGSLQLYSYSGFKLSISAHSLEGQHCQGANLFVRVIKLSKVLILGVPALGKYAL